MINARLRWSLTGNFTNNNLTDGGTRVEILVRWSLTRDGHLERFHFSRKNSFLISSKSSENFFFFTSLQTFL